MPTPYKRQVEDKLWALLEAYAPLTTVLKVGNRLPQTQVGWLREKSRRMPNDLPALKISAGRFTHSGFIAEKPTYESEKSSFAGHFIVRRRCEFLISWTTKNIDLDELIPLEEETQDALLKGGPRLGLDFVKEWGPISATPAKEVDFNGVIRLQSVMLLPVTLEFDGYELVNAAP